MNKKNLSVVMAGAMLATSVAPVLAEETTTVNKYELPGDQVGTLIAGLRDKMDNGPKFHSTDKLAGQSVYYVKINGVESSLNDLKNVKTGDTVTVWDRGHRTDAYGNVFSTIDGDAPESETVVKVKTVDELITLYNTITSESNTVDAKITEASADSNSNGIDDNIDAALAKKLPSDLYTNTADSGNSNYALILDKGYSFATSKIAAGYPTVQRISFDIDNKKLTVVAGNGKEFTLEVGNDMLDFAKPVDSNGVEIANEASETQKVAGYKKVTEKATTGKDIADVKLEEITITSSANGYNVSDLYDGLMLTEEGHNLLADLKDCYADSTRQSSIKYYKLDGSTSISTPASDEPDSSFGIYGFVVEYKNNFGKTVKYTITGSDKTETKTLLNWLGSRDPKVDLFGGSNRYETAVTVAKDVAKYGTFTNPDAGEANIVLVNGNSLVDGLSAAPLAASLKVGASSYGAPILLTESGKLPTATKNYLKELVDSTTEIGKVKNIVINIVGGKSVVSKEVETELKNMGFSVNRVSGDNREETSLAVMEEIAKNTKLNDNVFVVGANGEADAMSIAPVASTKDASDKYASIVVAKNGGITEDALEALEGKNVTVIGGESVVSASEYSKINSVAKNTQRVAGANRKATNAAIIKEFYTGNVGSGTVLVAKDGMNNKSELIDSLSATILASKNNAPIVLATDKLTDEQVNNVELATATSLSNARVYQIGNGVNKSVIKSIAQAVALVK